MPALLPKPQHAAPHALSERRNARFCRCAAEAHNHAAVRRPFDPPVAGVWCDGYIEFYRRVERVWSGFVRYSTEPGVNYLGWFEEPRIRRHWTLRKCQNMPNEWSSGESR